MKRPLPWCIEHPYKEFFLFIGVPMIVFVALSVLGVI